MSAPGSGRKRVRPARKIVPRGRMGPQWVVAPIVLAALIVAGLLAMVIGGPQRRDRAADLAAEFWDWLKIGR